MLTQFAMDKSEGSQSNIEDISIEIFSDKYGDEVRELISCIQRIEFDIQISLKDQPDLCDIPGFYQQRNGNFWVALCNAQPIGTISLLDIGNNQVALRKMFVHRDFRGSKFNAAKKLLDVALDWCTTKGVSEIYLGTTSAFHAAHKFYEKNGFSEISKDSLPSAFPIMNVDTKFYLAAL